MSYVSALEAAGAKVLASDYFGSYQGDWFALVEYNGVRGWVRGAFGSCSVCDSFQAEFDYFDSEDEDPEKYQQRLAAFGAGYLENIQTQEEVLVETNRNVDWDLEAEAMVKFVTEAWNKNV